MTRAASWSIKGVGFDARQAAQQAARRAGMSVGDWINEVIAEQAAELGVEIEDFGDDDRMEAVAGRLSRLSGRDDDEDERRWRDGRRARRGRRPRMEMDEDGYEPRRAARGLRAADAERLLESAVDAFERRSARASSRTAAALASVADRLGDLEARLDDQGQDGADAGVRESLDRLEHRMETLARRAARPERAEADAGLRGELDSALRDLGQRIDHVAARLDKPRAPARDAAQDHAIAAIERKLSAVLDAVNQPHREAPRAAASPVAIAAAAPARPRVGRAPVSDLVAEIERRQRDLDEPARARRPVAPLAAAPDHLESRLDQLAQRVERVAADAAREAAERVAQDAARAQKEDAARAQKEAADRALKEAAALAEKEAAFRAAQEAAARAAQEAAARAAQEAAARAAQEAAARAEKESAARARREAVEAEERRKAAQASAAEIALVAAREAVARSAAPQVEPMMRALHSDVARLADRMEEMRKGAEEAKRSAEEARRAAEARSHAGVGPQEIEELRREISGLARGLNDLDARQPVAQLDRAVRDLARRVETSRADGASEAVTAPVARLVEEMRESIRALDPRPGFASIERALLDVARRFDGAASQPGGADAAELAALRAQNGEIRALVDKALTRLAPAERIERQIAALGDRLDRLAFTPAVVSPPEIAQAIGEIRAMMAAAVPAGSLETLESRVGDLADQIARLGETRGAAFDGDVAANLDRRLGALAEKMDRLGGAHAAPADAPRLASALDDIRTLVGAAAPAGAVKALERQIEGLAGRLDQLVSADPRNDGLAATLGEIRAMLREAGGAGSIERKALERQIAALADRLDGMSSARAVSLADGADLAPEAVSEAMAELRQIMAGGDSSLRALERRVGDLADRIGAAPAALAPLDVDVERIADEVARRVRAVSEDEPVAALAGPQEQALRELLADISERVSEIRRPGLQDETLQALRGEIGRLAERLDRAEDGSADVAAMSNAVSGLIDRIDQMREISARTAQDAARAALREAMDQGLTGEGASSQEIETLKARQGEAERRSNATLGAVHDTLEKIVDRLAQLEDEVDLRVAAPVPAQAPPQRATLARAVPDDGFGDEPLGLGQTAAAPQTTRARAVPAPVPSAVSALAEDLLIEPGAARGAARQDEGPERRDAAAFIAAARRMTQQSAVEAPEPPAGIAARAAQAAQAARAAILAKAGKGEGEPAGAEAAPQEARQEARQETPARGKFLLGRARAKTDEALLDELAADGEAPARKRTLLGARKRPILIGLIGLTLALGALMYMNFDAGKPAAPAPAAPAKLEQRGAKGPAIGVEGEAGAEAKTQTRIDAPNADIANRPDALKPETPKPDPAPTALTPGSAPIPAAGSMAPPAGAQSARSDPATTAALPSAPLAGPKALREAAGGGDPAAQYEMALRFLDGRGGAEKDPKVAMQWLERAAGRGLAPAQYRLGALYEKGVGVARDPVVAKNWYQRAADAGNARAMHNLAVLTAEGAGDKPDYAGAAQWFVKASELGVRDSQYNLAILYARGLGVEQNLALSYTWFATAAKQGDQEAAKKRDEIAVKLDATLLEQAKETAKLFRAKALDPAANEVAPPPGGWDKAEGAGQPYGGVGVRPVGRPRAG